MEDKSPTNMSTETIAASPGSGSRKSSVRKSEIPVKMDSPKLGSATAANAIPSSETPLQRVNQKKYSVFNVWQKRGIVLLAAAGAFFSPLTGQIYFPSLPTIAREFQVSIAEINLTVTVYMVSLPTLMMKIP